MAEIYLITKPESEWVANPDGKAPVLESSVDIHIRITAEAKKITAARNIEKARANGTAISDEGAPPGGSLRMVERDVDEVRTQMVTAMGVTLPVGIIAALVAQAIDDFAREDRERATPPAPIPEPQV